MAVRDDSRLVGYVEVQVGSKKIALPVQSVRYDRDSDVGVPGGLFQDKDGTFGILIDEGAAPEVVKAQIAAAAEEAGRRLARRLLN